MSDIKDICFIIPNYNQLYFLRNLVVQLRWYYPDNQIYVVDNGSTYQPLLDYYRDINEYGSKLSIHLYEENDFVGNLSSFIAHEIDAEYYVISDSDISIHPTTPPNFLEYFKRVIDEYGFHHCGFDLIYDDIPEWNPKKAHIQYDEKCLHSKEFTIDNYSGWVAALDTTFCLWKRSNKGWYAPMSGEDWSSSVRLFKAIHQSWYLHKDYLPKEMVNYYNTIKKRELGVPSAGRTNYNPYTGMY